MHGPRQSLSTQLKIMMPSARVSKDGLDADGDSIMGLLMLAASQGTSIQVETSGPQAAELMDALEALVADKFGEGM